MDCFVCDGTMRSWVVMPIDPKKGEPTPYGEAMRCEACGMARSARLPEPSEVAGFYELERYYTQNEGHMTKRAPRPAERVLSHLAYRADDGEQVGPADVAPMLPEGGATLDVGAGGGVVVRAFAELGFDAYGVEPDANAIGAADADRVFPGTAEALPEAARARAYDAVSLTHVLEHCLDPAAALAQARSVLRPDGLLWVEVPNASCAHFERFGPCSEMFDAPRHLYHFTEGALLRAVRNAGFSVERTYHHGFQRHFFPSWRDWEAEIYDQAERAGGLVGGARHDLKASAALLARTARASASRKFDCVGVICRLDG